MGSEAEFSISEERSQKWWEHFRSFSGYRDMWSDTGWAKTQILPHAKQLLDASNPRALNKGEKTAFILPIVDRYWCITVAQINANNIINGAMWASRTGFALFDFNQRLAHSVPYGSLLKVKQEGETIVLTNNHGGTITIKIKVNRPSEASNKRGFIMDVVRILGSKSISDDEAALQRSEREADEYWQKVQEADGFIASVHKFFSEIITKGADPFET